jgi:hypothetical protein
MKKLFALVLAGLGLVGCAGSAYMIPHKGVALGAPVTGKAQVVFIRPSSVPTGLAPTILDSDGTFLGEAMPSSHFAVQLAPGKHTFVAWGEGTHSMQADLAPGKTYYVKIEANMGVWSARFHLLAVKGPDRDKNVKEWLDGTTLNEVKLAEGQAGIVNARRADADETIKKGVARFAEYDAKEKDERTLLASDGV